MSDGRRWGTPAAEQAGRGDGAPGAGGEGRGREVGGGSGGGRQPAAGERLVSWVVGGGLILGDAGLLLVRNRRRDGSHDWSPPGGVIEDGESLVDGLTREVAEETGVEVLGWDGPAYEVHVHAPDMGWRAHIEVHVARGFRGDLRVDDPDGIVVDAAWVDPAACGAQLVGCRRWVREPLLTWIEATRGGTQPWPPRAFRYNLSGSDPATAVLTLL